MTFIKKHGNAGCALVPGLDMDFLDSSKPNSIDWFIVMDLNTTRVNNRDWNIDSSYIHTMD